MRREREERPLPVLPKVKAPYDLNPSEDVSAFRGITHHTSAKIDPTHPKVGKKKRR